MKNISLFILRELYTDNVSVIIPRKSYSEFVNKLYHNFEYDVDCYNLCEFLISDIKGGFNINDLKSDVHYYILDDNNYHNAKYGVRINNIETLFDNIDEFESFARRMNKLDILK